MGNEKKVRDVFDIRFEQAQGQILDGLRDLVMLGGTVERLAAYNALRILRPGVFDVSYETIADDAENFEDELGGMLGVKRVQDAD